MIARPKPFNTGSTVPSEPIIRFGRIVSHPQALYSQACEDADGNAYTVIAWRPPPVLGLTEYTLDDGRPVKFLEVCLFEVVDTGTYIACR